MAKFIMLDHSLYGVGGHHYAYAVNVLLAAEAMGLVSRVVPADETLPFDRGLASRGVVGLVRARIEMPYQ